MKTRKLLAVALSILMIISVMPTTIFAAPTAVSSIEAAHETVHHTHDDSDAELMFDGEWVSIVTEVKYGTSADSLPAGANLDYAWAETDKGNYYQLQKNAAISATLEMPELERILDLNGFTLTVEGNIPAFAVNTGTLTVVDSSVTKTGKIVSAGSVIEVGNGTVVLTGGTFEGSKAIDITSESVTYADLLGINCFYTNGEDDTKITDEATLAAASKLKVIKEEEKITITMADMYGNGWDGAAIEIYENSTLLDTITVEVDSNTHSFVYNELSTYTFKWRKGGSDDECGFEIKLGASVLKTVENACEFTDGEIIYTIESSCEHDWTNKDGVCKVCGYECPGHTLDENNTCTICGFLNAIVITMVDDYGDSWNGAAIEVYKDDALVDTITVAFDTNTYTLSYDKTSRYTFKWKKGFYDNECSFEISLGATDLKTVDNAYEFTDGEVIYTIEPKCEHDVSQPCGACALCSKVCGTDFDHIIDENRKCSICSFECGVTAEHDWTNRDGVCKVCGYECPEHSFDENYVCTICTYSYKALVTSEDGTSGTAYEFINEALEAAQSHENCTVKLLDNVTTTDYYTISNGKFTIDLNGKTWESSQWVLLVSGTADIKITDSTGEGGIMKTTGLGYPLILLHDTAKLEIAGGSFESLHDVVNMSYGGETTSSELLISGGKLKGRTIVYANGSKMTITDGEIEEDGGNSIYYEAGTLDLSQYANADKISFDVDSSADVSSLNLIIPEGYVIIDKATEEEVTQLEADREYIIAKHVVSVTNADGSVTTNYTSLEDAIEAAELLDNSTVKLLDNISVTTSCYIDNGKFTIDLNGKTWESSQWVLFVSGTADIKITDSTGEGGIMKTTVSTCDLIVLYDTAKLEIAGGSFESLNYVVDMSDSGLAVSSELIISGGKLSGYAIVNAKGSKVTVTDGEFEKFGLYSICYITGTLDLSQYADADKIVLFVDYSADVSTLNLILPEGFELKNLNNNEEVTQLEASKMYAIANASGSETAMVASVTTQDGTTITEYTSIGEALTAASSLENSTVKLLDNISATTYYEINSGKFTIDLNGKIWQSTDVLLYIKGTSQIKICDSSENAAGLMTTSGIALIVLMDETKLEIESGNFSCTGNYIFNMSNSGMETSSELLISGGWFVGNSVASVAGRKVTINSGEFDCAWGYPFEYLYGTLDLSNYKGASELGFYVPEFTDASALELILPAGAIIRNYYTEEIVTELASGVEYRIESSIEINLGEKADETNVRYAEIGGVVTELEETDNKYLVAIGEENKLIEVVEKTADGEFVKSQYFYVDMTAKTATKLSMDSYMTTDGMKSVRIKEPMGIRFRSSVLTSAKYEETEFVIDEYGYIVATEEELAEDELTLDFRKYAKGIAYNTQDGTDIVFDSTTDGVHTFTCVVKNVPVKEYKTNLVCKTYTKVTVDGEQFVVYGEAVTGNIYDTAQALLEGGGLDVDMENALAKIIFDFDNAIDIPGDDLYPDAA